MRLDRLDPNAAYDQQAWSAAEHARAWGLLQMLADGRSDVTGGIDRALLDRRRVLWSRMSARATAAERAEGDPTAVRPPDRAAIDDMAAELQVIEARIRSASQPYVALVEPRPIAPQEVQHTLLDGQTVLLEFALGDEQSWAWAITADTFQSYKLAPRSEIDAAARRVYGLLASRQAAVRTPPLMRVAADDAALRVAVGRLTQLLLDPIASQLAHDWKGKRLVAVTTGSLDYVPFGILTPAGRPLLEEHEIVSLPSATVLAELRRDASRRSIATRTLAVIADPVFDAHDPRVARGAVGATSRRSRLLESKLDGAVRAAGDRDVSLLRTSVGMSRSGFARLLFSHEEAAAIARFAPAGSVLEATDFRASHDLVVSGQLAEYRFVHFATHGQLNSRHPELSGLVLSLVDQNGRPVDGFLRLGEIYNLHLGAELVVLSACQTALGKEIKGDGLVGLTRGFMYAGAPRVIASLWQVDDLATSELMRVLYRGILKQGLTPAAALRAAQLHMMKQERWAAPYYWAAFTLQGEWR
jgi:CHAT domain-containing protein